MAWELTDDASTQYVRRLEGSNVYQLIEMSLINPETNEHEVYEDTVNVDYYIRELKDELLQILSGFGYTSVENVIHEYGGGYEPYQVMAECIFEYYGSFQALQVFTGSENDCIEFIKDYVDKTNEIWYRSDYDGESESQYFVADGDEDAIEISKGFESVINQNLVEII